MTKLMKKVILVPSFVFFLLVAAFYQYCYVAEHIISSIVLDSSLEERAQFTVTAECKGVRFDTFAPYVSVRLNDFELLKTAVNPGYDTLRDCMNSSIEGIEFLEVEEKVRVYMKNGEIKEVKLIYDSIRK
ncbi:MAG: hypothetical protein LC768_07905 [Acidobacteria bacterium]|nr:hypothetical protein [Acidobacteriota bacterium]MCA1638244.1 hypothetical protein [Acidobacteriota bacterium]